MQYFKRHLNLPKLLEKKSFFLFGPRSTGKTHLIKQQLASVRSFDLLDHEEYVRLLKNPKFISEIAKNHKLLVIDEIQKMPSLLDEVHRVIENNKIKFLLTGSSARKLKRGGTNLLAGRAWEAALFPLVSSEIKDFNLHKYLNQGGLPHIYLSSDPQEELEAYSNLYLTQEVAAEALIRNLEGFSRFLDVIAFNNGNEINFQQFSSDCGVAARTLDNYLDIIKDTLLGFELPAFRDTIKRKAASKSKFFLFDIGVTNYLAKRGEIKAKSELFGKAFEHFILLELRAYLSYKRLKHQLSYWAVSSSYEVDIIIGKELAIECKSSDSISHKHLKGLKALKEEALIKNYCIVSLDKEEREIDGIQAYPWKVFLEKLWSDQLLLTY